MGDDIWKANPTQPWLPFFPAKFRSNPIWLILRLVSSSVPWKSSLSLTWFFGLSSSIFFFLVMYWEYSKGFWILSMLSIWLYWPDRKYFRPNDVSCETANSCEAGDGCEAGVIVLLNSFMTSWYSSELLGSFTKWHRSSFPVCLLIGMGSQKSGFPVKKMVFISTASVRCKVFVCDSCHDMCRQHT